MFQAYKLNWSYDEGTAAWLRSIVPAESKVLLCPCGMAYHPGALRVDRDPTTKPDIIADMQHLPFKNGSFDVVISDPPYKVFVTGDNRFRWVLDMARLARKMVILSSNINVKIGGWKQTAMYATTNSKLYIRLWQVYEHTNKRLTDF